MSIWAIADLHLPFGDPSKNMEVFGDAWKDYTQNIETNWKACVGEGDLVLIPGDISWAKQLDAALIDLEWIDALPGKKLILKGNHDPWWPSLKKLISVLPPSVEAIHNTAFEWNGIAFGGSRLWDSREYRFDSFIEIVENPVVKEKPLDLAHAEKIFVKELGRLRLSLSQMNPKAQTKIALTHYPPIGADLKPSRASALLEEFGVDVCVFGHLHSVKGKSLLFGTERGVSYILTSADYLSFTPIKIFDPLEKSH